MARQQPKLRFNCYLLRRGLEEHPELALRSPYRPGGKTAMTALATKPGAPTGASAYFRQSDERQPTWASRLSPLFGGLDQLRSTSNRLVIFLPVGDRVFAVCFGYGSNSLEWACVESNFGLRVAARAMSPRAMKELRSLRLDGGARTQQIQVSQDSGLRELDVELEGEFVSRLVGRVEGSGDAEEDEDNHNDEIKFEGALIAGDSIAFQAEVDLGHVQDVLLNFLQIVESSAAREEFSFVDALEPLKSSEATTHALERRLAETIFGELLVDEPVDGRTDDDVTDVLDLEGSVALCSLVPPDAVATADIYSLGLARNSGKELVVESTEFDVVVTELRSWKPRYSVADLKNIRITAYGADGDAIGPVRSLLNWLVFEFQEASSRFILTLGKWFRLQQAFSVKLDSDLSRLPDRTAQLGLPDWTPTITPKGPSYHETEYNASVSGPDWLLYDHAALINANHQVLKADGVEVEACDLFHVDGRLVHVKKWTGSATASHLLSQGAVSAELLQGDPDFKNQFVDIAKQCCSRHQTSAERAPSSVIYAIGGKAGLQIPQGLPTFTKVNLRTYSKRIRTLTGQYPGLAKINMI